MRLLLGPCHGHVGLEGALVGGDPIASALVRLACTCVRNWAALAVVHLGLDAVDACPGSCGC